MMKKLLIILLLICSYTMAFSQMPTNGDYSNWDWEDQSQANWKRKSGTNWIDITPPFLPQSERLGDIVDVYATEDYTKAKGWKLVWAQFDGVYPYFILYNEHKSIIRSFFYLDDIVPITYSYVLATLSYHDTNNPGVLSYGNNGLNVDATDSYLNGTNNGENDQISVIIPDATLGNWCSADFPILFDNNIKNSRYASKKWVFKFHGCDNYGITVDGTNPPSGSDKQHTIINGEQTSLTTFSAAHAKFQKHIKSQNTLLNDLKTSVNGINSNDPEFLKTHKENIDNLKAIFSVMNIATGMSSGIGAVLGFFKFLNGTFDEDAATPVTPSTVAQSIPLSGSMTIERDLGGTTLKIPGVNGTYFPPVTSWNPYDCPIGIFNLKKEPTFKVTKPYSRYGCIPPNTQYVSYIHTGGYAGKYKKYKLDEDIHLTVNEISGLQLIDVYFAIVCKPNGSGNNMYNIEDPTIAEYQILYSIGGQYENQEVENLVYKDLMDGRFIIHKYDTPNNEIYFGTPFIEMNRFKGITFEVPEYTDVQLKVYAKFESSYSDEPVIFSAAYNIKELEENPDYPIVSCSYEQTNFLYSDYYLGESLITLSNGTYTSPFQAKTIVLKPGFTGQPNFTATAINIYPSNGNTVIDEINYNCTSPQGRFITNYSKKTKQNDEVTVKENLEENEIFNKTVIYPNPSNGYITIESPERIRSVSAYDFRGVLIVNKEFDTHNAELDLTKQSKGIYYLTIVYDSKVQVKKVILK